MQFIRKILLTLFAVSTPVAASDIDPDALWIDVRTPDEFSQGHVSQAINIPHNEISDRLSEVTSGKDGTIYVYCKSGGRANAAKKSLEKAGYTHVINLGGLDDALKLANEAGNKE